MTDEGDRGEGEYIPTSPFRWKSLDNNLLPEILCRAADGKIPP